MKKDGINEGHLVGTVVNITNTEKTKYGKEYCHLILLIRRKDNRGREQVEKVRVKLYNGLVRLIKEQLFLRCGDVVDVQTTAKTKGELTEITATKILRLR